MTDEPRDDEERDDDLEEEERDEERDDLDDEDSGDSSDDASSAKASSDADEDDDDEESAKASSAKSDAAKTSSAKSDAAKTSSAKSDAARTSSVKSDGAKQARKKRRKKKSSKARPAARAKAALASTPAKKQPEPAGGGNGMIYALVALVVGVAIGWFGHQAKSGGLQAGPDSSVVAAASPSGSGAAGGPCDQWAAAVCKEAGDTAEACGQARAGAALMPASACQQALTEMPATVAKIKDARSTCDELAKKLCKDIGEDTESCKLVTEKTPSFPAARCQQMMGNYDKVLAELQAMEKKNAPLTPEVAAKQAAGDGPSFGPADAKVTVVEYSDFQCPFCSKAAAVVKQLKENYADRVRFVFRQYPLPMHPDAPLASQAALAAHEQGKFWAMHDLMFENQRALDRESLEGYAEKIGLDMAKFKKALDDKTQEAAMKADMSLGQEIGVSGTPTMIVGTKRVPNPTDYAAVSKLIDGELAAAAN